MSVADGPGISLIVAAAANDVIGRGDELPWHLPEDLRRFKRLTRGHVVVAGRRTHESIVRRLGTPLPDRVTVVVTRRGGRDDERVRYRGDVVSAVAAAREIATVESLAGVFVIGGAEIYAQALPMVTTIHLTRVHEAVDGDSAMPAGWLEPFELCTEEAGAAGGYTFQTLRRRTSHEDA